MGRAAEALRRIKAHLPPPIKRKRKWVFILWISRAPGRGAEEASQRAPREPSLPAPSQGRAAAAAAPSAGGTCCLNCSNPKAEPPAGGAAARRLKAASEGALHDAPSLFSIGSENSSRFETLRKERGIL